MTRFYTYRRDTTYAITLHQPWASLIALGLKTVETRSWPAPARLVAQRIAIHAGSGWSANRAMPSSRICEPAWERTGV